MDVREENIQERGNPNGQMRRWPFALRHQSRDVGQEYEKSLAGWGRELGLGRSKIFELTGAVKQLGRRGRPLMLAFKRTDTPLTFRVRLKMYGEEGDGNYG